MINELDKNCYSTIIDLAKLIKPDFSLKDFSLYSTVIVYKEDENIIGFLEYYVNYEIVELLNISVSTNYQNKGIATKLIEYLYNLKDVDRIILEVRASNVQALNLYNKLGFKIIRTIKNYYGSEEGYAMERSLV